MAMIDLKRVELRIVRQRNAKQRFAAVKTVDGGHRSRQLLLHVVDLEPRQSALPALCSGRRCFPIYLTRVLFHLGGRARTETRKRCHFFGVRLNTNTCQNVKRHLTLVNHLVLDKEAHRKVGLEIVLFGGKILFETNVVAGDSCTRANNGLVKTPRVALDGIPNLLKEGKAHEKR